MDRETAGCGSAYKFMFYFTMEERLLHVSFPLQPTSSLSEPRRNKVLLEGFLSSVCSARGVWSPFISLFHTKAHM